FDAHTDGGVSEQAKLELDRLEPDVPYADRDRPGGQLRKAEVTRVVRDDGFGRVIGLDDRRANRMAGAIHNLTLEMRRLCGRRTLGEHGRRERARCKYQMAKHGIA